MVDADIDCYPNPKLDWFVAAAVGSVDSIAVAVVVPDVNVNAWMKLCDRDLSSYIRYFHPNHSIRLNLSFQNCHPMLDYHYLTIGHLKIVNFRWRIAMKSKYSIWLWIVFYLPRLTTATTAASRLAMTMCKLGHMASMLWSNVQILSILNVQILMESIRIRIIVLSIWWRILEFFMNYEQYRNQFVSFSFGWIMFCSLILTVWSSIWCIIDIIKFIVSNWLIIIISITSVIKLWNLNELNPK